MPRARRNLLRLLGLLALAGVALAGAALIPGSHGGAAPFSVKRVARSPNPANPLGVRVTKVFGSNIPAKEYGTIDGAQENQGIDAQGQLSSGLSPIPPAAFARPIARYRAYAERWTAKLAGAVGRLQGGLSAGDRAAAEHDWDVAFGDYLHLGAVYGLLPSGLARQLAEVPPSLGERSFPGLHRLEQGLWTGAPLRSLLPVAAGVSRAVVSLRRTLPRVSITPLAYATRAHEILEDAQRDFMSGTEVPWSGAGVLATAAATAATQEVIATLAPLMEGRNDALGGSQNMLGLLARTLASVRRRDGSWPSLAQLSAHQHEHINGMLDQTLSLLQEVPGTLETTEVPVTPTIAEEEHRR